MWIVKRDLGACYFGPYLWERDQQNAVRFASRRLAMQTAILAAKSNSGVTIVRLVPKRRGARKAGG